VVDLFQTSASPAFPDQKWHAQNAAARRIGKVENERLQKERFNAIFAEIASIAFRSDKKQFFFFFCSEDKEAFLVEPEGN
jgi:hypothetical protein